MAATIGVSAAALDDDLCYPVEPLPIRQRLTKAALNARRKMTPARRAAHKRLGEWVRAHPKGKSEDS